MVACALAGGVGVCGGHFVRPVTEKGDLKSEQSVVGINLRTLTSVEITFAYILMFSRSLLFSIPIQAYLAFTIVH